MTQAENWLRGAAPWGLKGGPTPLWQASLPWHSLQKARFGGCSVGNGFG